MKKKLRPGAPLPPLDTRLYLDIREVAEGLGMTVFAVRNMISQRRFPMASYKLGRRRVVDRMVFDKFFEKQREIGLKQMEESPPDVDGRRPEYKKKRDQERPESS